MKMPSGKVMASAAAVVILAVGLVGWYLWGVELDLTSVPGGAEVLLDGKPVGRTGDGGSLVLSHLARGRHVLNLTHPDFAEWTEPLPLGWIELSRKLRVTLPVPTFPVTILTNPPGASVQIDGKDVGSTDSDGKLVVSAVPRGTHSVSVTMHDYPPWSQSISVAQPESIRADLAAAAAAVQQEITSRLEHAKALFEQRDYQGAVAECDAVLHLDPSNQQATNLKAQVQQTMSILGIQ